MADPRDDPPGRKDDAVERLLIDGLRSDPLSDAAMQRLRESALQEWRFSVRPSQPARSSRHWLWAAAAAAICIALGASWFLRPAATAQTLGSVMRVDAGGGEISVGWLYHRAMQVGSALKAGDVLTSHGPTLIALTVGGTLRIAPDSVLKLTSATDITLQRGRIYLDFPPGGRSGSLAVRTWAGTIVHVGTEFEVLSNEQVVRIRVREGRVQLRNDSKQTVLDAGTQLTANRDGTVARGALEPYGRDWLWAAELAPDYEIEGQPLLNFLQWAARELGRPLKFSDPHAREVAERTVLHGSVKGRDPLDALGTVLETTSLTYEIRGETIWIQSGHGT